MVFLLFKVYSQLLLDNSASTLSPVSVARHRPLGLEIFLALKWVFLILAVCLNKHGHVARSLGPKTFSSLEMLLLLSFPLPPSPALIMLYPSEHDNLWVL